MANKNSNLNTAKREKNDEFYTQLTDIEKELCHYKEQFRDKVVYCNCDDARQSNFFKFFSLNFEHYGLKKLITTSFNANGKGTILIYEGDRNGNRMVDDEEIQVQELNGNGDFRSEECVELLKQADIVVTNPPFSLFREYVAQLVRYGKKFLIIGSMNAVTYKEIFPLFMNGNMWFGISISSGDRKFYVPQNYTLNASTCGIDDDGKRFINVKGVRWFTNMETNKHNHPKCLIKPYNESEYPKYDNYNAINVDKVKDIPYDYEGVIGVPITILNDLCSDGLLHFEAPLKKKERERMSIGLSMQTTATDKENESPLCLSRMRTAQSTESQLTQESSSNVYRIVGNEYSLDIEKGRGYVNGKRMYSRIFIQRVN